jgi:hypothetical protein
MTDYPPPNLSVTPIQSIVVAFVVASFTILFWKGVGAILRAFVFV